jgi:hypothetical protein
LYDELDWVIKNYLNVIYNSPSIEGYDDFGTIEPGKYRAKMIFKHDYSLQRSMQSIEHDYCCSNQGIPPSQNDYGVVQLNEQPLLLHCGVEAV